MPAQHPINWIRIHGSRARETAFYLGSADNYNTQPSRGTTGTEWPGVPFVQIGQGWPF